MVHMHAHVVCGVDASDSSSSHACMHACAGVQGEYALVWADRGPQRQKGLMFGWVPGLLTFAASQGLSLALREHQVKEELRELASLLSRPADSVRWSSFFASASGPCSGLLTERLERESLNTVDEGSLT